MAITRPTITWNISLGHIITALIFIFAVVGDYFINQNQLQTQALRIEAEQKLDDAVLTLKLVQEDQKVQNLMNNSADFKAQMRTAMDAVTKAVYDIRVQLVLKEDIKKR